jgi:hypothetical protein
MTDCKVLDCDRKAISKGLCNGHYMRLQRRGDVQAHIPLKKMGKRGAGTVNEEGYRKVSVNGKKRGEHRVVMERILGRSLLPTETVHHKNGHRSDNRPSNLELWSTSQPPGQRVEDKVEWAREILDLYGDTFVSDQT